MFPATDIISETMGKVPLLGKELSPVQEIGKNILPRMISQKSRIIGACAGKGNSQQGQTLRKSIVPVNISSNNRGLRRYKIKNILLKGLGLKNWKPLIHVPFFKIKINL